jgi:hypothetical protein
LFGHIVGAAYGGSLPDAFSSSCSSSFLTKITRSPDYGDLVHWWIACAKEDWKWKNREVKGLIKGALRNSVWGNLTLWVAVSIRRQSSGL